MKGIIIEICSDVNIFSRINLDKNKSIISEKTSKFARKIEKQNGKKEFES
jgi:hypothetical protein